MTKRDEGFEVMFDESVDDVVQQGLTTLLGRTYSAAEALYELDPDAYEEQRTNWAAAVCTEALSDGLPTAVAKTNESRFRGLCTKVERGCVVPFVGAGLSVPSGMPGWSAFLLELAAACRRKRLVKNSLRKGNFEQGADQLIENLGVGGFQERYRALFSLNGPPAGPVTSLAKMNCKSVVTTNFDEVVETAFGVSLRPVLLGRESADFCRCVASGQRALLKLHGDINVVDSRVLTRGEYDAAYGDGEIDFSLPVPKGLRTLFCSITLLFVGCSLGPDRTMRLFQRIADDEGRSYLPEHYAILPWQGPAKERYLTERQIFPIWYPGDRHDVVETLLQYIAEEVTP